jgi:thiamine pyrophosphokinase
MPAEEGVDRHNSQRPAVVFAGGDPIDPTGVDSLPVDAFVIAADSGLDAANAVGVSVDIVVGDLDSATPESIADARAQGIRIEQHPTDKDATDLELALALAVESGATEIVVLGGYGGRLDHLLANALLLAAPMFAGIVVRWCLGTTTVAPARPGVAVELAAEPGDRVSLLPVGGPTVGVTTFGLRWPLHGETLHAGSTRGVSNQVDTVPAVITVEGGTLLTIHEGKPT